MKKVAHEISSRGFCSRREAERLILENRVLVNDKLVCCADRVDSSVNILIDNEVVKKLESKFFIFHKPIKYLTSHNSQKGYKTIFDLIKIREHLTFIGRLDYMSEGLVVLTNSPEYVIKFSNSEYKRVYEVFVDRVTNSFIRELENPILFNQRCLPIKLLDKKVIDGCIKIKLELREGKNREIRRLCEKNDIRVLKLKKIQHGPFQLLDLEIGKLKRVDLRFL